MARIAGVDLPPNKRLWVGLTAIYGIGQQRARSLAEKANVDATKKIKDLTEDEVNRLRAAIEAEGRVEGDLRKEMQMNIRRLIEIQAIAASSPPQSSGARPADAHQRPHPKGSAQGRRRGQEENDWPASKSAHRA